MAPSGQSDSKPLTAILNVRGNPDPSGARRKKRAMSSA